MRSTASQFVPRTTTARSPTTAPIFAPIGRCANHPPERTVRAGTVIHHSWVKWSKMGCWVATEPEPTPEGSACRSRGKGCRIPDVAVANPTRVLLHTWKTVSDRVYGAHLSTTNIPERRKGA